MSLKQLNTFDAFNPPHFRAADWQAAYEEERRHRVQLQGEVADLQRKIKGVIGSNLDAGRALAKVSANKSRHEDLRRAVAQSVYAALIVANPAKHFEEMADDAVAAADELLVTLSATMTPKERFK